jgi:hypothetical protein
MPFDGSYPAPPGNKRDSILDRPINGAYTAIGVAVPPTGGILVNASEFGLSQIEWAQVVGSDNGQYDGVVYMAPYNKNQPSPAIRVQVLYALWRSAGKGEL